jgi:integrase/recombinase XerD
MILAEAIKNFKFHCEFEKNLSKKTLQAYTIDLNQFESYEHFAMIRINDFNKNILKEYIKYMYEQQFKAKTIKRKLAVIKTFFTYLEFDEIILVSPFRKMNISIKEPKLLPKTMDLKEIRRMLKHIYVYKDNHIDKKNYSYKAIVRDLAVIEILFSTGMRVSELCNIKYKDVNIQTGNIKIYGKGSKERVIQICENEVKKILREYQSLFKEQLLEQEYYFLNRLHNKLSEQSVRFMIKKYQKQSGLIKHITPHMFRHSFATLLLEEGVDIRYIQHMLGHSSISTTQIYTKVNMKQQRKILNTKHPRRGFCFVNE